MTIEDRINRLTVSIAHAEHMARRWEEKAGMWRLKRRALMDRATSEKRGKVKICQD